MGVSPGVSQCKAVICPGHQVQEPPHHQGEKQLKAIVVAYKMLLTRFRSMDEL